MSYPSITSIIHYYFTYFLNKGSYNDGVSVFAHITIFASALPIFLFNKKNKIYFYLLAGICFYLLINSFGVFSIWIIYCDALIGMFWGVSIILYLKNKEKQKLLLLTLGVTLFCMVQIKNVGIALSGLTIFIIFINELFLERKPILKSLKGILILVLIFIASRYSWKEYLKYSYGYKEPISLSGDIGEINRSNLSTYKKLTIDFWNKFKGSEGIEHHLYDLHYPYTQIFLFLLVFVLLLCFWFFLNKNSLPKIFKSFRHSIQLISLLILGFIGYLFINLYAQFQWHPVLATSSFYRYMGIGFVGIFIVFFYVTLKTEKKRFLLLFLILILPVMHPNKQHAKEKLFDLNVLKKRVKGEGIGTYGEMEFVSKKLWEEAGKKPKKILVHGGYNPGQIEIIHLRVFPMDPTILQVNTPLEDIKKSLQEVEYFITWLPERDFYGTYGDILEKNPHLKGVWVNRDIYPWSFGEGFKRIK